MIVSLSNPFTKAAFLNAVNNIQCSNLLDLQTHLKTQYNIIFRLTLPRGDFDELIFESEEEYFLFLMRWL